MTRPTTFFLAAMSVAALSAGCTAKDVSDDSPGDDTNTTSDDTSTDDSLTDDSDDGKIHFYLTFQEFLSQSAVSGATVTMGGQNFPTDSSGLVDLVVEPHTVVQLQLAAEGFRPFDIYRPVGGTDLSTTLRIASESTLNLLSGGFNLPLRAEAGLLTVPVLEWDGGEGTPSALGGVTVDLDVAYDAALTSDSSASGGLSQGNTTITDGSSSASVTFANVTAGAVTTTLTPPEGYTCDIGATNYQVEAGHFVFSTVACHQ